MSGDGVAWDTFHGSTAEAYAEYLVPAIFGPFAQDFVDRARLELGDRLLDLACGTGTVAITAAKAVGRPAKVVGVDLNPTMLAVAADASAASASSIEWLQASADSMPLEPASFNLVMSQQGFQFFPDRVAVLREVHRVLSPGGRVLISVWRDVGAGFDALASALARQISPDAGTALSNGPSALSNPTTLVGEVKKAGFEDTVLTVAALDLRFASAAEFVRRYMAATPLGAVVAAATEGARTALVADVEGQLRNRVGKDGLVFRASTNIVCARRT